MEEDMIMSGEDVTNIFVKKDFRPKKFVSNGGAQAEFSTTKYRYRWPGGVVPYESDISKFGKFSLRHFYESGKIQYVRSQ